MSEIANIRVLLSELRLLTRAQIHIMHLVKDKAKNKKMEDCVEEDFDDTIQLRFVAGGRIPLSNIVDASVVDNPQEYTDIIKEIRSHIRPLQDHLMGIINDVSNKAVCSITDVETMDRAASWIEESEEDFCSFRPAKDEPGSLEFLEKWSLCLYRKDLPKAEEALESIQGIINRKTKDQRDALTAGIKALTDANPI